MTKLLKGEKVISVEGRPFMRAALTSRLIGVAALTLGAVFLYALRETAATANGRAKVVVASLMFIVPGTLYFVLATFISRRRRWAVICGFALAWLDMLLLGVLFMTAWGTADALMWCTLSGLFLVALAVMTTYLGKSLETFKRRGMLTPDPER